MADTTTMMSKLQNDTYQALPSRLSHTIIAGLHLSYTAELAKLRESLDFPTCNPNYKSHQGHLSGSLRKSKIN